MTSGEQNSNSFVIVDEGISQEEERRRQRKLSRRRRWCLFLSLTFLIGFVLVAFFPKALLGNKDFLIAIVVLFLFLVGITFAIMVGDRKTQSRRRTRQERPTVVIDLPPSYEEVMAAKAPETPPPAYEYVLHV